MKNEQHVIIELQQLINDDITSPVNDIFTIAVLSWLIPELSNVIGNKVQFRKMSVVKTHGKFGHPYPALGIYSNIEYFDEQYNLLESTAKQIVVNTSILELLNYIEKSGKNWSEELERIMTD